MEYAADNHAAANSNFIGETASAGRGAPTGCFGVATEASLAPSALEALIDLDLVADILKTHHGKSSNLKVK